MSKQRVFKYFLIVWALSGMVACKQAVHAFSEDSANQESNVGSGGAVNGEIPSPELPVIAELPPDVPLSCAAFLKKDPVIDFTATEDKSFTSTTGTIVVPEALRTVYVASSSGSIDIRSAITATIESLTGQVRINANTIRSAKIGSGELCIRANHIGLADADMSSGSQVLAAQTIDVIHLGSGAIHVYRAAVQRIEKVPNGKQGYKGQICLHDGATIIDFGPYNPNIAANCD